jgi:hypothetical protein
MTNDCTGTVIDIIITDQVTHLHNTNMIICQKPPVILFKPNKPHPDLQKYTFSGIDGINVVPIFPQKEKLSYCTNNVYREQLPFLGGYAFTDYKVQRQTFERLIIDGQAVFRNSTSIYLRDIISRHI